MNTLKRIEAGSFKWVTFMVYELYLSKDFVRLGGLEWSVLFVTVTLFI